MWEVTPVFLCPHRSSALDFSEQRDLHRPSFCDLSIEFFLCLIAICRRNLGRARFFVLQTPADLAGIWICL